MKLIFILPNLGGGGAERVVLTVIKELSDRKHKITLFLFKGQGKFLDLIPKDVNVVVALKNKYNIKKSIIIILYKLFKIAKKHDIVVGGLEGIPTILAFIVAKIYRKKSIGWLHINISKFSKNNFGFLTKHSLKFIYPKLSSVVCVSNGVLKSVVNFCKTKKLNNLKVIYNPLPHFNNNNFIEKENLILSVGRLKIEQKGFDLLIKAFSRLKKKGIRYRLAIIGEGPDREKIEQLINDENINDSVILPGFVGNIEDWYKKADIFVLPSRYEGFGLVLIEALHFGLPIVSANCESGPSEILENGKYGLLVKPNDENGLFNGLLRMLNNKELRENYKKLGQKRAELYSPRNISLKWNELFTKLIG